VFLVGGFNPSEKYESQLGMMKFKKNVPNHQPGFVFFFFFGGFF